MKKVWPWIIGIVVGVLILALLIFGGTSSHAYRVAKGAINARVEAAQDRIDSAVALATKAVDQALAEAGNLPSQLAQADLIKQDIEEIGNRLNDAAQAQGQAAIEQLNASIDQFNQTLQTVEQASNEATDPAVKSTLDSMYCTLESTKELVIQTVSSFGG